ncbi:Pyrimidine-nucleoside phosphorylase, partial [Taenia solium]
YISDIDAGTIAQVVWRLGAGRDKPDDAIDHTVGIRLLKHVGDAVKEGEAWCIIYFKERELDSKLEIMTHSAITVLEEAAETPNVIVEFDVRPRVSICGLELAKRSTSGFNCSIRVGERQEGQN